MSTPINQKRCEKTRGRSVRGLVRGFLGFIGLLPVADRIWLAGWTAFHAAICRRNYTNVLRKLRRSAPETKFKVLFLVGEPAKWKCQRLYEAMEKSGLFEPVVGLTAWNAQTSRYFTDAELDRFHGEAEQYFDFLGDRHIRTYVRNELGARPLSDFGADLVFYSEQWAPPANQTPRAASRTALSFFVPYFVPSFGDIRVEGRQPLHWFLYAYFTLNGWWAEAFRKSYRWWNHTTEFVPAGHPSLDCFGISPDPPPGEGCVVYAPHYSFPHPKNHFVYPFSTFDWSGKAVLEYAKAHPGFNWVFKPHPLLRLYLVRTGVMSKNEADAYYADWERIGKACYDGSYQGLFAGARAMVTDSCTFLMEFGATGKPIIHLRRHDTGVEPVPPARKLFDSYYSAYDLAQMHEAFRTVLERREDPKRETRLAAVAEAGLSGASASDAIVAWLCKLLRRSPRRPV